MLNENLIHMKKEEGPGARQTRINLEDEISFTWLRGELIWEEIVKLESDLADARSFLNALDAYLDVCIEIWMRDVEVP